MKRGSAPATCRQAGYSSGLTCHPHPHPACFPFTPPPAPSKSKSLAIQPSALPTGPHYGQQPTKSCCWEITSQTGKSLTDSMSENARFVCSVLYWSGEGASAAKPFWLWSLHGKGRFQLGVAPRLLKQLSSSHFPAAGSDGARDDSAVQGLGGWGGLAIYCPRRKYGFKSRLSYGWSMWCWSNSLLLSASIPWWNQGSRSLCKSP